jgi:mannitol-1-phosphate 5-dehydrogenase
MGSIAIFGAGRISRGFLAHLLSLAHRDFFFIEKDKNLVDKLNTQKKYSIHVMGHSEKDYIVDKYDSYTIDDVDQYISRLVASDLILTSIGGQNLSSIAPIIARAIEARQSAGIEREANIITCENWIQPAIKLKAAVLGLLDEGTRAYAEAKIGFSESVVLRSATDAEPERLAKDPLVVNVQDYWTLHIDAATVKGTLPAIEGFEFRRNFAGMLTRKLYTYNAANATVSYLGYLKGYSTIYEAIQDPGILSIVMQVYEETSRALSKEFNISYEEQYAFSMTSLAKLRSRDIVDFILRNARDPIRKLGPEDRLVGPSLMALKYGFEPSGLATGIAAALFFDNPKDESAVRLRSIRLAGGIEYILDSICHLADHPAFKNLIHERIGFLRASGWIKSVE